MKAVNLLISPVAVLFALPATAQPLRIPDNFEGSPFGVNSHTLLGESPQASNAVNKSLDTGLRWHRVDFNWFRVETSPGVSDFSTTDAVVNEAAANGIVLMPVLGTPPAWEQSGGANPETPRDAQKWKNWLTAVVGRYRDRVKYWEIWNEPDGAWDKGNEFVPSVAAPAYEAIKAADPESVVVGPATINCAWLGEFLSAGGADHVDVVSFHAYGKNFDEFKEWVMGPRWAWECWFKDVIDRNNLTKPVWITEFGQQTNRVSEEDQSLYLRQVFDLILGEPWFERGFIYELYDPDEPCDNVFPDRCWALFRKDWSGKRAAGDLKAYVAGHLPRPNPGPDRAAKAGEDVVFDGSASVDPDGSIVSYTWDFDRTDGVKVDAAGASVKTTFARAGEYEVTLIVTDDTDIYIGGTTKITIVGAPARPRAEAAFAVAPITVDGDLADWPAGAPVQLGPADYEPADPPQGAPVAGVDDLSVTARFAWDAANLYVAFSVRDDTHANSNAAADIWRGDSVQLALDVDLDRTAGAYDNDGDYEFGFALANGAPLFERWQAPAGAPPPNAKVAVRRAGAETIYEAAAGIASLPPLAAQENAKIGFSFLVNDDDGAGREGWEQWTPGISRGKDPAAFGELVLVKQSMPLDGGAADADATVSVDAAAPEAGGSDAETGAADGDGTTGDSSMAEDVATQEDAGALPDRAASADVSARPNDDVQHRSDDAGKGSRPETADEANGCSCAVPWD
ncbi:MAG: cellulase family glycosylhydrolase [Deltaproteobacteria bacterium]|nr:cellulase family glycosylhydrolase [Deltaproteobacteria bacterium]